MTCSIGQVLDRLEAHRLEWPVVMRISLGLAQLLPDSDA